MYAADYGIVPDDGNDDRLALQHAIDTAVKSGTGVILQVPPGRYHLDVDREASHAYALHIVNAERFTLMAEGAEFVVRNPRAGFLKIERSSDVTIKDLVVDYDPLPFFVGRIVAIESGRDSFVVESLPGHGMPDHSRSKAARAWGYFLDPNVPGKLENLQPNVVYEKSVESIGDGRYRYRFDEEGSRFLRGLQIGTLFTHLVRGSQLFLARNSSGVRFERITSYASPAGHYVANNVEDISVVNCRAVIREGRAKGGNGDGIHFQNTRGPVIVRGNVFEGLSDDGVNVYQRPHYIVERRNARTYRITADPNRETVRPFAGSFRKGDRLMAFDDVEGRSYGGAVVASFDYRRGWLELESDWGLPEQPAEWKHIGLLSDHLASDVNIASNTFMNSRRFGVYLKSHRAVVANNRFINLSGSAIVIANGTADGDSGFSRDVLVDTNWIEGCGFSRNFVNSPHWQAISVFAQRKPYELLPTTGLHANVRISSNTIVDVSRGFFLHSIDGLEISGNRFLLAGAADVLESAPVQIEHCARVRFDEGSR
jgi:hypothetical protein